MNKGKIYFGAGLVLLVVGMLTRRKSSNTSPDQITNTDEDMQVNTSLPRGYRNNNPLNIRISSNQWQGKISPNTDGAFEQFTSMAYGYRAAMVIIRTYVNKYGCNTLASIISRWAPSNENNTTAYIQHVSEIMGVSSSTYINPNSKTQMTSLVYAMSIIENGRKVMPNEQAINEAWELYSKS